MTHKVYVGIGLLMILIIGIAVFLLNHNVDTEPKVIYSGKVVDPKGKELPPAKPGFEWVQHDDHFHEVPLTAQPTIVEKAQQSNSEYGITRQGKRYKKNPAHADVPAATATPTGPPLNIDWQDAGHPPPGSVINWRDPRTWESYRNFWGFEPPTFSSQTGYEYRPRLDNWGIPLQHFDGTEIIFHYKKRIGFRPSPEQLVEYKQLQAQLENARVSGDNLRADILQQDIQSFMNSARGELPIKHTFHSIYYGPPLDLDDKDKVEALQNASIRDLYKRMGIEHLYEFYEQN